MNAFLLPICFLVILIVSIHGILHLSIIPESIRKTDSIDTKQVLILCLFLGLLFILLRGNSTRFDAIRLYENGTVELLYLSEKAKPIRLSSFEIRKDGSEPGYCHLIFLSQGKRFKGMTFTDLSDCKNTYDKIIASR